MGSNPPTKPFKSCSCPASPPCSHKAFTEMRPGDVQNTLARKLIPVADSLRDLFTRFGGRPYTVRIIRTRWTGGGRGKGEEIITGELKILPTPLVMDLSALTEIIQPVGLDEVGGIRLTQVSGRYSEDQLRGLDFDGTPPDPDEQTFYEIDFLNPAPGCSGSAKRRFYIRSAPMYYSFRFQWELSLEKSHEDRARNGELR